MYKNIISYTYINDNFKIFISSDSIKELWGTQINFIILGIWLFNCDGGGYFIDESRECR
jgi:hypothetical protein